MSASTLLCLWALAQSAGEAVGQPVPPRQAAPASSSTNLLVGLPPARAERTSNVERMTDGQAAEPGDGWNTYLTSIIEKEGNVTWDFGQTRDFHGVWLQADNNDVYVLATSEDGTVFTPVWESSTVDNAGMQTRSSTTALGRGRYVRLTAKGGDGMFSVGELALFADSAQVGQYVPKYVRTAAPPPPCDGNWLVIALVLAGVVYLVKRLKPAEAKSEPKPESQPPAGGT
jgi:hypothetical protein